MFCFDVETAGVESNSVILSAALVPWSPEEDFTWDELLERACFVKFDVLEQMQKLNRKTYKSTLEWWDKQSTWAKVKSLIPNKGVDVSVEEGVQALRMFYHANKSKNNAVWIRGSLDQVCFDSLTRVAELPDLAPYNAYRDVRTAIDLLKDTAKDGYCPVPNFDPAIVKKHDPIHDCAYDILMMRYGV